MQRVEITDQNREECVRMAVDALLNGEAVVIPTDTIYGIAADARNEDAVKKVFEIKGREEGKSLPIFVANIEEAKEVAELTRQQEEFLNTVWPGKVTAIVQSKNKLAETTGTAASIGLRIPEYALLLEIMKGARCPVTGTSANLSGEDPIRDGQEAEQKFRDQDVQPVLILDAGELPKSLPSTVADIRGEKTIIVRQGAVDL